VRVVLDTNIVLSALVFRNGRLSWLRQAWQTEIIKPVVCRETVNELLRVLAYPKFRLSAEEREELLADFLPWAETAVLADDPPDLPDCRDPADLIFMRLAREAKVEALVSGDNDLLALRQDFYPSILTAEELGRRLDAVGLPKS
jgi:putative PIN family toxin of toxin-antitoxin system